MSTPRAAVSHVVPARDSPRAQAGHRLILGVSRENDERTTAYRPAAVGQVKSSGTGAWLRALSEARSGEFYSGRPCRDLLRVGASVDPGEGVSDARESQLDRYPIPFECLEADAVEDAAGVDHESAGTDRTAFAPPKGMSIAAILSVIASANRSPSAKASAGAG